ncbi:CbiX/SirB N-terminal domain-containing protein [Halobacteriales archaeon Cl-PHB]
MTATPSRSLVLVGHGSHDGGRPDSPAFDHAEAVRATGEFDRVESASVYGDPTLADALASASDPVVVPLFLSDGYYTRDVLPAALAAATSPDRTVDYAPPVGTHAAVTDIVRDRIDGAVPAPDRSVGLALVGHGSTSHGQSGDSTRAHAAKIRETGPYSAVKTFFLDEDRRVDALVGAFDTDELVVVPFFVSAGHHVTEDVPDRVGFAVEAAYPDRVTTATVDDTTLHYTPPVGTSPQVVDVVLARATAGHRHEAIEGEAADDVRTDAPDQRGETP